MTKSKINRILRLRAKNVSFTVIAAKLESNRDSVNRVYKAATTTKRQA